MDADDGQEAGSGADGEPFEPIVPFEIIPAPAETRVVTTGPRRRHLVVAGVAVVAVVAAAAAVVLLGGDDGTDPAEALAAAQEVVEQSESFRFEQLAERHVSVGDPDGAGSDTTTRTVQTGTVSAPDRWHIVEDYGDEFGFNDDFESIRIGDQFYSTGFAFPGSASPPWVVTTIPDELPGIDDFAEMQAEMESWLEDLGVDDDPYEAEARLDLAIQAYLWDGMTDPATVTRVVSELTEPVVEEERGDGGVVLRARLAPVPELAELGDIPPVDVVLHLDADRRPVTARFTAEAGSAAADVEVAFSDWGSAPEVQAPPASEVDATPWIAEEDLAGLDPSLLLAPTTVPSPFELTGVSLYDDADILGGDAGHGDGSSCPSLSLTYGVEEDYLAMFDPGALDIEDPDSFFEDMRFLDVTISDPSCAPDWAFADVDFTDELGGHPASGSDGYWDVQIGDLRATVTSSLGDAELDALVASIGPTTPEDLVAAIPAWVAEAAALGGGGFVYPPMGTGG